MKTISSVFFMLALMSILTGCGGTYVVQQDGTHVPATFVEANAPRVKASLSVSVCPEGMHEAGETTGYISHEATLDTDRGRYGSYNGYQRESPVQVREAVGGRKDFTCVPDNNAQEEQK